MKPTKVLQEIRKMRFEEAYVPSGRFRVLYAPGSQEHRHQHRVRHAKSRIGATRAGGRRNCHANSWRQKCTIANAWLARKS